MMHRTRLPHRRPTAGELLASLPAAPTSLDVWAAEARILQLAPGERGRLRYALAGRMGTEEYRAVWRHPLGGRPDSGDGRLVLVSKIVARARRYGARAGCQRGEQLPWVCARAALSEAGRDGCSDADLRGAAAVLAGMVGCDTEDLLPPARARSRTRPKGSTD